MTTEIETLDIEIVPSELGLEQSAKLSLESSFSGYFKQAEQWKLQADTITDPKLARTARLEMKKLRVDAEKTRKALKEDSLRMGKAIDGANNILLALIVPIEKHLEDIEKQEERRLAAEREQLIADRTDALRPFIAEDMPIPPLGDLTDEQFQTMLADAKMLHDAKIEAARKAEAERIEREKKEAEEREAQRLENIRLKAEAEKRESEMKAEREAAEKARKQAEAKAAKERAEIEAKAAKERAEAEAKAKKERDAREKAENEARELKEQAEAKAKAEAEAKLKAEAAPDKERLCIFADELRELGSPIVKSDSARKLSNEIGERLESLAKWIESQAKSI